MKCKRKNHEVVTIGMKQAQEFVYCTTNAKREGRKIGEQNARSLVLMLAYGVDAVTANAAANDRHCKDNSAAHQLKWKAINSVSSYVGLGLITPVKLEPLMTLKEFNSVMGDAKFLSGCADQELAAAKAVLCFGAPVDELEQFCEVSASKVIEIINKIK